MHYLEKEFSEFLSDPQAFDFLDKGAVDGFWYWDVENPDHEWMSAGFWHALGFDPADREHLAAEWQDLIFPEDRDVAIANFMRHCADPTHPYDQLVRYRTKDGGTLTVRCRGIAVRENGVPKRMLGSHTIVNDTRQTEIDRQLSHLLELSEDAILVFSEEEGVLRWNQGAETMYGILKSGAVGADPNLLTQAEFPVPWSDIMDELDSGKTWAGSVIRHSATGRRLITSTRLQRIEVTAQRTLILQIDRDETETYEARERERLLTKELFHRVKNLFSVIQSLVRMSFKFTKDPAELETGICDRITALAVAQAMAMEPRYAEGAGLRQVVEQVLVPFVPDMSAMQISGEDIPVSPDILSPLGLILNELATNAVKYGALRPMAGQVLIHWNVSKAADGRDQVAFVWEERCKETLEKSPDGADEIGFGTRLLDLSARQISGTITRDFRQDGLRVNLNFPVTTRTYKG